MLRSQDVIGVSVVADDTDEDVGSVKDVIVHRARKSVLGFLVRRPGWLQHLSVLPFSEVLSFSESSIVAKSKDSLISVNKAPDAVRHLERKPLPGTTLITIAGHELGRIEDFSFDEESGELKGFDVSMGLNIGDRSAAKYLRLDDGFFIGKYDVITSESAVYQAMPETREFACFDSPTVDASEKATQVPAMNSQSISRALSSAANPSTDLLSEAYRITTDANSLTVVFEDLSGLDDLCIARLREKLLQMRTANPDCSTLRFDVTHLKLLPSVMLGLLANLRKQFTSLEIINPSKDSYEVVKMMGFDKLFKIRELPA